MTTLFVLLAIFGFIVVHGAIGVSVCRTGKCRASHRSKHLRQYFGRWFKHAIVNLGQAWVEIKNIYRPTQDALDAVANGKAPVDLDPGTVGWVIWGFCDRLPNICLGIWYAALPPETHDGHNCEILDHLTAYEWWVCASVTTRQLH